MTIQRVQGTTGGGPSTPATLTTSQAVQLGNLVVVTFGYGSNNATVTPPDSSWRMAVLDHMSGGGAYEDSMIFYLVVDPSHAGLTSFVFTLSASHSNYAELTEWFSSNGWPANPLDQTAYGPTTMTTSNTVDSGTTGQTAFNSELWVAALGYRSPPQPETNITPGWTWESEVTNNNITLTQLWRVVSGTGQADVSYQISSAAIITGCVATFRDIVPTIAHPPPPAPVGPPGVPQSEKYAASYSLRVLNTSRQVVGALSSFRRLSYAKRFNSASEWVVELDAFDPQAANLLIPGYGLSITRTVTDIKTNQVVSSGVEVAGPLRGVARSFSANTLTVSGYDYLFWLMCRTAYPTTTYQYYSLFPVSPLHHYHLADAAGVSTFADAGTGNNGATKTGTVTSGITTTQGTDGIDNLQTATAPDGTTGYLTVPNTGWPTGNSSWSVGVWAYLPVASASLAAQQVYLGWGTWGTNLAAPHLTSDLSGFRAGAYNGDTPSTPFAAGLHLLGATWDGTTLTAWLDSLPVATVKPGALVVPTSPTIRIFANPAATPGNFAGGSASGYKYEALFMHTGVLTPQQWTTIYQQGVSRFGAAYSDNQTGPAETVIKHYVNVNAGPGAASSFEPSRQLTGLVIGADSGRGTNVTGTARFDRLVMPDGTGLLQQLATIGGLGFKQSVVSGQLTFDVYTTTDRTASIIFSNQLGTVLDFNWSRQAPDPTQGGNVIIVGGGGVGTARTFQIRTDTGSIGNWGRCEYFLDARDTSDIPTIQQRGDTQLVASKEVQRYSATLTPNESMVYGVSYFLGDKVTAVIDGQVYQDLIREVDISIDQNAAESVTPIMGTTNAILPSDASMALSNKLLRQLSLVAKIQNRT